MCDPVAPRPVWIFWKEEGVPCVPSQPTALSGLLLMWPSNPAHTCPERTPGGPPEKAEHPQNLRLAACFRGGCRDGVPWTGRSAHSKGTLRTWGHQSRTASEWRFPPSHRTPRVASNTRSRRLSWSGPCRTAWPGTSGLGQRVHPGCRKRPWGLVQGRLPAQPPSPAASVRSHLPVTRFPEGVGGVTSPALRHCAITRGHRRRRRRPRRNSLQMETSLSAFRRGSLLGIHTLVSHLPPRPHF